MLLFSPVLEDLVLPLARVGDVVDVVVLVTFITLRSGPLTVCAGNARVVINYIVLIMLHRVMYPSYCALVNLS